MKKKRWICIMLCSMMLFGTVACGKDTEPLTPAPSEKVTLMFEVDEGLGRAELTTIYGDDRQALDKALYNICDGLAPLKAKYDVSVLIYPTWHYYEEGYAGKDPAEPLNRISDDLKYVLEFFGDQKIGVYCFVDPHIRKHTFRSERQSSCIPTGRTGICIKAVSAFV